MPVDGLESQLGVTNVSQKIGDLQTWRKPRREAADPMGAGGGGPAESGALAGPVPSVQELSAGMHLRFLLHPKEPPCWVPGLCSQPPNPLLGQLHGGHFTWSGGTTSSPASEGPGTWHVPGSRSGLPELTQKLPFPHGAAAGLTASQALRGGPSTSQCLTL